MAKKKKEAPALPSSIADVAKTMECTWHHRKWLLPNEIATATGVSAANAEAQLAELKRLRMAEKSAGRFRLTPNGRAKIRAAQG